jgi:hypothetical protein
MALFKPGKRLTAQMLNEAFGIGVTDVQDAVSTTTSGGYTAALTGGQACGVAFVAPASGKVVIHYISVIINNTTGASTFVTPRVKTGSVIGSGTDVVAAADENSLSTATLATTVNTGPRYGGHITVTGLTVGSSYNVQLLHRVSAGTGTFSRKRLTVHMA